MVSLLRNWRRKRTRIMYGDQALFVPRRVFEALGGFAPTELEDVFLMRCVERPAPRCFIIAT